MEQSYIKKIETIFIEKEFPIPKGFFDKDVDSSAPSLFTFTKLVEVENAGNGINSLIKNKNILTFRNIK